ncbi:aspartate aminotransferase family protein [Agrobacterium rhizogenes]|nr:aspartate aminotransferase family protein [Rhizobium rhizogenes]NTJ77769.1 aspartate aminotransferase family protein [Rhizobium rhizogenes]
MFTSYAQGLGWSAVRARSSHLFGRGKRVFPAGLTRSTIEKDPIPIYLAKGEGAHVWDADGNRLLDLNNNFTTLIHGHGFQPVIEAVIRVLTTGTCFANPTEHEIALAELLISRIPAMERVRFVNSGTEAVMFAIKAARAFTGRSAIVRFSGAYHGAYDWAEAGQRVVFDEAGKSVAKPAYPGAPEEIANNVVVLDFNDAAGIEQTVASRSSDIAAILIDPMPSRAGLLHPTADFIAAVSSVARKFGILIIADEVLNLRQAYTGASARYGLEPDLITVGKIIGGGFPVGAIGGRVNVMAVFGTEDKAPLVSQGGTFSANPVSMVAGKAAMEAMTIEAFDRLEMAGDRLRGALSDTAAKWQAPFSVSGAASLFRIHPRRNPPTNYQAAAMTSKDAEIMRALSRHFLACGIILPFDAAACLSTPMTEADIDSVLVAFDEFLEKNSHTGWGEI